jgi:ectoine hydroxylase-related dioxygenase (phytanoyl-CoA dioxygenase family)
MLADLDEFDAGPRGPLRNHWQGLRPPPVHPHLHRDIVFNEQVIAVLRAFLGDEIVLTAYGANTAYAAGDGNLLQRAHIDHSGPQPAGSPCQAVAVQVVLVDTDEDNGATEYWPGSHLAAHPGVLSDRWPSPEQQATWPRGSGRFVCRRGTIVVRDLAMWHRGTPNRTAVHRPMLTMIVRENAELRKRIRDGERVSTGFEARSDTKEFWQHPILWAAAWLFPRLDYMFADAHSHPSQRADADTAELVAPVVAIATAVPRL